MDKMDRKGHQILCDRSCAELGEGVHGWRTGQRRGGGERNPVYVDSRLAVLRTGAYPPFPTGGPRWLGPGSSVNNALELAFPNPRWLPEPAIRVGWGKCWGSPPSQQPGD